MKLFNIDLNLENKKNLEEFQRFFFILVYVLIG